MGPDGSLHNDSLCFSSDDDNHYTTFLYQVSKNMTVVENSANNAIDLCSYKHDFGISTEWVFFATSYCKSPCDDLGGAVKTTCSQVKPSKVFE